MNCKLSVAKTVSGKMALLRRSFWLFSFVKAAINLVVAPRCLRKKFEGIDFFSWLRFNEKAMNKYDPRGLLKQ